MPRPVKYRFCERQLDGAHLPLPTRQLAGMGGAASVRLARSGPPGLRWSVGRHRREVAQSGCCDGEPVETLYARGGGGNSIRDLEKCASRTGSWVASTPAFAGQGAAIPWKGRLDFAMSPRQKISSAA